MSLMSLGVKINALQKGIKEGRFTTKEQVKTAAMELNVSATIGYENLSEDSPSLHEFFRRFRLKSFRGQRPEPHLFSLYNEDLL